jgi:hypothetical protein
MHPDLDTIVAADEEGCRRVAEERAQLAARVGAARAAGAQSRDAQTVAIRARHEEAIRALQDASRLRIEERRRRHEEELQRRRERSEPALETAADRYLAILFPEPVEK